ncbi:MAG: hypothetical protein ABI528_03385 [bacterium]
MLFRIFFYFLPFFFIITNTITSYPAIADDETDVIVIGTVHYSTDNYSSDSLLRILNMVMPDVILVECDTSYMTSDFKLKEDIEFAFMETRAITKYSRSNNVLLRPYDIEGRDDFLDGYGRKKNESGFYSDINYLSQADKLSSEGSQMFSRILSMINISEEMANATPSHINSEEGRKKIDTINFYSYAGLRKLIDLSPGLSGYDSYWKTETEYWNRRNNVMIENIVKYKNEFEGKRIVVLCGLSHLNILKNGLNKKLAEEKIKLREYREFTGQQF